MKRFCLLAITLLTTSAIHAATLIVNAPPATTLSSATATTADKSNVTARTESNKAIFESVPGDVGVNVQLTLKDNTVLQGVDLSWYNEEPPVADAGPLTDDDREAIRAIVQDVPSFYNKSDILLLAGDHSRAVGLVQLIRDTDFHASGDNVVWRVELYYFKFQYGGWEKVQQQNKIVRRERFKSVDAYGQATEKLKWIAELGGIKLGATETKVISVEWKADKE